jgi:hypothetical protein
VDEGNNWINMFYGPLSLANPTILSGGTGYGVPLGNYALTGVTGSPAIDYIPSTVGHPLTDFFGNPRPDPSNPNFFDIGAIEFQGVLSASTPTLASIAPASSVPISPGIGTGGLRGTSVVVILTGANLLNAQAVNVSGSGVNCTVTGSTSTTVNATCAITATAGLGARSVTVTTAAGTSPVNPAVVFTVMGPTLTSIAPTSGLRSTTVNVTLTGTGLTGATWSAATTTGFPNITFGPLTVNTAGTQATASLTISAATTLGAKNFSVTTPIGTTNTVTFTVVGPTLTSIAPTSGARGAIGLAVTIAGANLTGATAINAGAGITATGITVNAAGTQITATFAISATAALGARNVTVTTPSGTSPANAAVTFRVQGPTLASITPASGVRGVTGLAVTIAGANLAGATAINAGAGITATGITVNAAGTQITATFAISATAALGARNVTVTTPNGTTPANAAVTFTVQGPTLTSIAPNTATHPASGTTSVPVTLTGTNLAGATGLTGLGTGVSVATGTFQVSSTSVTATLNVASTATAGISTIAVTTPIGTTNTVPFTVN